MTATDETSVTPPTKPSRATWLDRLRAWMPEGAPEPDPAAWLDRAELLDEVRARGAAVTPRALAHWESENILPRGVRRWIDGSPRARYPEFAVDAIVHLRALQAAGLNLQAIRPYMESWIAIQYSHLFPDPEAQRPARETWLPSPEDIEEQVTALARRHERVHGGPPIVQAEVRLTDAAGHEFVAHAFAPVAPAE